MSAANRRSSDPVNRASDGTRDVAPPLNTLELFRSRLQGSAKAIDSLQGLMPTLAAAADAMIGRLRSGGTVYTAGNGGSATQALHLAEELIGRYRANRSPLRAVCLNADPAALTCIANDFGFSSVFSRQCEALIGPGDVLVAFSTSGRSANIVAALQTTAERGALRIGLLGSDGGACLGLCDHALVVPNTDSAFIQDAHQVALHLLCEAVERAYSTAPCSL